MFFNQFIVLYTTVPKDFTVSRLLLPGNGNDVSNKHTGWPWRKVNFDVIQGPS